MRGLELKSIGDLVYREDLPKPKIGSKDVLLEVKAVGVCGSDFQRIFSSGAHKMPIILGHEFSGLIVETGSAVKNFKIGDRVTAAPLIPCGSCRWCKEGSFSLCDHYDYIGSRRNGAMAEYVSVPENNLLKLPQTVDFETAAMIEPAANAVHALWIGKIAAEDTVCICGAGPIGLLAVQVAKAKGAKKVFCIDMEDEKLDAAKALGADEIINTRNQDLAETLKALTAGEGVDLILEATGAPVVQNAAVEALIKHGRLILLGFSNQDILFKAQIFEAILRKELKIYGSWNSFSPNFPGEEWQYILDLMEQGKLKTELLVSHKLDFNEGPIFFKGVQDKRIRHSKVIFVNS